MSKFANGNNLKPEDLKVLKRPLDLLNIVKIGQGQLQLIMKHIFVLPNIGVEAILVKRPKKFK